MTGADFTEALDAFNRGELGRARGVAEQALASNSSPQWQHLLGLVYCRLGKPQDALEYLQAALAAEPRNLQYLAMTVRALIDSGRAVEALALARRPAAGPLAAPLWRLRAEAAESAGSIADRNEAVRNLRLEELTARIQADPDRPALLLERGRTLGWLARDEEAEEDFRAVLGNDPGNAEAVRELGVVLERANRLGELRDLVESSISAGCDRESFALLEALLAWRSGNPAEALQWLSKVAPGEGRVRAIQLEIKVQDALGNVDAAFRAAESKNEVLGGDEQWREAARKLRSRLRTSAELITPEWTAQWLPVHAPEHRPLAFLVGFPRSGTTLLDTFLMGHSQARVLEEFPIIGAVAERLGSIEDIASTTEADCDRLRRLYLSAIANLVPDDFGGLVVDKMPLNMLWAPMLYRLFPQAKLLFAQRHPCDCVLSGFFQTFNLNPAMANFLDLADASDFYDVAMDVWTRSERSLPLSVHRTVYERLVADPEPELRSAIEFLGLKWEDSVLDHRRTAQERGAISTPSYEQVTGPLTRDPVFRWRRYEEKLDPVLPVLLPWAERLGYEA